MIFLKTSQRKPYSMNNTVTYHGTCNITFSLQEGKRKSKQSAKKKSWKKTVAVNNCVWNYHHKIHSDDVENIHLLFFGVVCKVYAKSHKDCAAGHFFVNCRVKAD